MEGILHDIPNVVVYIDDILIMGVSEEKHLETLECVLDLLETVGLRSINVNFSFNQLST